jgi:hypothetical protein
VKDQETGSMWFIQMPAAPAVGSILSISTPDVDAFKVVRSVEYVLMGAQIEPTDVKPNPNEYPVPWNPNGYPGCSLVLYVDSAVWNPELKRWADPKFD